MKSLALLICSLVCLHSNAQTKKVAVTVDDLPTVIYGKESNALHQEIITGLLETFKSYNIPAIGFVNEQKLYKDNVQDSFKVSLLKNWLKESYELGNHTFSHPNYHTTSFERFTNEIKKGEILSKELSKEYGIEYKYFRHPFLRIGKSKEHADSLKNFLTNEGYIEAPVTIDNEDYLFAKAYHTSYMNDNVELAKKVADAYLNYMEEKILYFEKISSELFDRKIAQTLLIHSNLLNAHYFDELASIYKNHGYEFVSQTEVLKDSAYQTEVTRYGNWGISWLERWAISMKKGTHIFKEDPKTPDFVKAISN